MPTKKPNVKIEDDKVIFSKEILDYFESLRTEENSKWIDKYFKVLSDSSNINSIKFNTHHIKPCFTFKDETHKTRKQTERLADEFNENRIKLSIYNHMFAHYYLWKIFNNNDSKFAIQRMCGTKKYINHLTEKELKDVAILKEECAKTNQTDEKKKEYSRNYSKNRYKTNKTHVLDIQKKYDASHKEEHKEYNKKYHEKNKEKHHENYKKYYEEHKEERRIYNKKYYEENKEQLNKSKKVYKKQWYQENKEEVKEKQRKYREKHKDEYKEYNKQWEEEHREERKKQHNKYNAQKCIDPIEGDECTYGVLRARKYRNKEKYKDIVVSKYIIKSNNISI